MTAAAPPSLGYKACPADDIRSDFGPCRGGTVANCDALVPGDTFIPRLTATWTEVIGGADPAAPFQIVRAANLPAQCLHPIAELIFMTTTGRRHDVVATVCQGQLFLVSQTELKVSVEYVLIDVRPIEVAVGPSVLSLPTRRRQSTQHLPVRFAGLTA